jgi:orotate phosphoribosyltransferase
MSGSAASLGERIYARACLTGEFRLRSGSVSNEYHLICEIAEALVSLLPVGIETLAGLELGGVPLAAVLSQVSGLPTLFVRKTAKTYGTCRLADGGEVAGRRVAVIEDVVTSGGQVIESCRELRDREADIRGSAVRDRPRGWGQGEPCCRGS